MLLPKIAINTAIRTFNVTITIIKRLISFSLFCIPFSNLDSITPPTLIIDRVFHPFFYYVFSMNEEVPVH